MTVATAVETRVCNICGESKPVFEFRPRGPSKTRSQCRPCEKQRIREQHAANPEKHRWRTVRHRYGIDKDDYFALVAEQNGRCAICGATEGKPRAGVGERYWHHIDHDHETGQIRGLLCTLCNNGIGHLRHDPLVLRKAIEYLERGDDLSL